jgi:hypothetical protein
MAYRFKCVNCNSNSRGIYAKYSISKECFNTSMNTIMSIWTDTTDQVALYNRVEPGVFLPQPPHHPTSVAT